jgi:hypothetical protein
MGTVLAVAEKGIKGLENDLPRIETAEQKKSNSKQQHPAALATASGCSLSEYRRRADTILPFCTKIQFPQHL